MTILRRFVKRSSGIMVVKPLITQTIRHTLNAPFLISTHATSTVTPPASLIFFSAKLLKNLALTTNGISGSLPLPSTFE